MSRASILILLGVLSILTPFSGLPIAVRSTFAVILGACVFGIGLSLRIREARSAHSSAGTATPNQTSFTHEVPRRDPQDVSPV